MTKKIGFPHTVLYFSKEHVCLFFLHFILFAQMYFSQKKMAYSYVCGFTPHLMGNSSTVEKLTLKDDQDLDKLRSKAMCEGKEEELRGKDMQFGRKLRLDECA